MGHFDAASNGPSQGKRFDADQAAPVLMPVRRMPDPARSPDGLIQINSRRLLLSSYGMVSAFFRKENAADNPWVWCGGDDAGMDVVVPAAIASSALPDGPTSTCAIGRRFDPDQCDGQR